jgi:ribonuclease VapC
VILDTSAIAAVILKQPGWELPLDKMTTGPRLRVGTPTRAEAGIALTARLGFDARLVLSRFVQEFAISAIPFGEVHWGKAVDAYRRFGEERHFASLNFGDCMSYATASLSQRPLLRTGDDFRQTDLTLA